MKNIRLLTAYATVVLLVLVVASSVLAHGGGRDGYGGHNDRKNGGYHFHAGPLSGQSFASKSAAMDALRANGQPKAEEKPSPAPVRSTHEAVAEKPSTCDCDALARLLVSKGIITEAELADVWMNK